MKKLSIISASLFTVLAGIIQFTQPAYASEDTTKTEDTFVVTTDEKSDFTSIGFGHNLLLAGNNIVNETTTKGLLFSFGNQLGLQTKSDYTFIAGNIIEFSGETEHDVFIAGNSVTLSNSAKIGRDTFIASNTVLVDADLPGDFSAAAAKVVLNNVKINGNVNLDVAEASFTGQVTINGRLIINDDAIIAGLSNVKYESIEKYENVKYEVTATQILTAKIFSILGLFVTMVIVLALFARTDDKVNREMTTLQFGKDLVIGFCALVFIPIISIFLIVSFFAAPAGLVVLALYLVMLYLAQGFAGLWVGKLILQKLLKFKGNRFLEVLLGVIILVFAGMIPNFGWTVTFVAEVLGLGLILQSINPDHKRNPEILTQDSRSSAAEEAQVVETKGSKKSSKPADKKSSSTKLANEAQSAATSDTDVSTKDQKED